jgi:hypothetical protein
MQRERVADNVFYFQSDVYAQVTAGAVIVTAVPSAPLVFATVAFS